MDKILGLDEYIQSANPNRGGLGAFNAFLEIQQINLRKGES